MAMRRLAVDLGVVLLGSAADETQRQDRSAPRPKYAAASTRPRAH
jgi:hypothetical protein